MKRKIFAMVLLIGCLLSFSVLSYAAKGNFDFTFKNTTVTDNSLNGVRERSDGKDWIISIKSGNISPDNVFGCRPRRAINNATIGKYITYSTCATWGARPYSVTVKDGWNVYIRGKKDDMSSSSSTLKVSGDFTP